jgi:acyl-coenzyme A synthetase/AMP-(fatty) acid ligase
MPRALEFRAALPRSAVGKLLHKALMAEVAAQQEAEKKSPPPASGAQTH